MKGVCRQVFMRRNLLTIAFEPRKVSWGSLCIGQGRTMWQLVQTMDLHHEFDHMYEFSDAACGGIQLCVQ